MKKEKKTIQIKTIYKGESDRLFEEDNFSRSYLVTEIDADSKETTSIIGHFAFEYENLEMAEIKKKFDFKYNEIAKFRIKFQTKINDDFKKIIKHNFDYDVK